TRDLEGQGRRVNIMVGAVHQANLEVDDREADERTAFGHRTDALVHRRNVFARDIAALDLVDELVAFATVRRTGDDLDATELAGTTRLLLVGVVDLDFAAQGLAVGHLGRAHIGLDLELALHAVDQNLEMEFTHSLDHGLAALVV